MDEHRIRELLQQFDATRFTQIEAAGTLRVGDEAELRFPIPCKVEQGTVDGICRP